MFRIIFQTNEMVIEAFHILFIYLTISSNIENLVLNPAACKRIHILLLLFNKIGQLQHMKTKLNDVVILRSIPCRAKKPYL